MSLADCLPLINKIRSRINSWKHRFLSYAGRLQLLTSVISSLINFWISAIRLPSACLNEIEKICSAFLWSGPDLNTGKAKIAWTEVCRPKEEGGLGIKSINEANKVCCFKLIWRIASKKSLLWVDWIYRELVRGKSFWSIRDNTSLGSWIWKKILKYRVLAKEFHSMEVKSGNQTSFWFDKWSPMGRIYELLGDRGFIDLGIRSDATVADALQIQRQRRHRNEVLNNIQRELGKIRALASMENDISLWRRSDGVSKPNFTSKDTWEQVRNKGQVKEWHKGVWFSGATPKYCFLLWLAIHNRLTTGDRMQAWNGGGNNSCIFCQAQLESRDHLFFECTYSSQVWENLMRNILGRRFTTSFSDILLLMSSSVLNKTTRFILRYGFQATIHKIWNERNRRRHGEVPQTSGVLIGFIDQLIRNRFSSIRNFGSSSFPDGLIVWFGSRT